MLPRYKPNSLSTRSANVRAEESLLYTKMALEIVLGVKLYAPFLNDFV